MYTWNKQGTVINKEYKNYEFYFWFWKGGTRPMFTKMTINTEKMTQKR